MNSTAELEHRPAQPSGRVRQPRAARLLVGVLLAGLLWSVTFAVPSQHFLGRIAYNNPTAYDLDVEVSTGPHDGWMTAGTAQRHQITDNREIYDIGTDWWFRYSAQGRTSRAFHLTRRQLERAAWLVSVPPSVGTRFEATLVPPQPN